MQPTPHNAPQFFIIGAQKAGTTWLWHMLDQHPGTSLPEQKEIHYFGSSELYARGDDWYFGHFDGLEGGKLVGEASTTYFYDRVPYFYNPSDELVFDDTLPTIPELILKKFPDARFIVVLRDPVRRAISAYLHWMRRGEVSPLLGLTKVATDYPKMRILEYGYYAKYLETWKRHVDADRFRIFIFEDDVKKRPEQALVDLYSFLGLDTAYSPELPKRAVHKSWGWTRVLFSYYAGKLVRDIGKSRLGRVCDRFDILGKGAYTNKDVEFLRSVYLPEKERLQALTGNSLECWDYGERLLR